MSNHLAQSAPRVLEVPGTLNFRDIGGYTGLGGKKVRWGKAYRSAQLDRLEPEGVSVLKNTGFQSVFDLRFEEETSLYPTMLAAFPNAKMVRWQDLVDFERPTPNSDKIRRSWRDSLETGDPEQVREAMRINYPTKLYSHQEIYKRIVLSLIEDDTPILFHCAAGKDRTGVAAALVLALLGVDDDQIMQDYMLTQQLIEGRMEAWLAGGATTSDKYQDFQNRLTEQSSEMIAPVLEADPAYMQTLLEYVATTYGSFETYALQQLELSNMQIDQLRANLLD